MRIPVFARRANPAFDRPILKKSLNYVTEQVESGRATWVDPLDPAKGILCREVLYFGERAIPVETVSVCDIPLSDKAMGLKFIPPKMAQNPTLPRVQSENLLAACERWDWSTELISA